MARLFEDQGLMSFVFDIDGSTVWSPALDVGSAYISCAQALGSVVGVDPGFTFVAEDYVETDPVTFLAYVRELHARATESPHPVMSPLIDAVLIPSLVMLDRAGLTMDLSTDPERQEKVQALRTLPR